MMQCLDPMENKKQLPLLQSFEMLNLDMDVYNKILAIADVILDAIDMDQLLSAIAVKTELRPDSAKIKRLVVHACDLQDFSIEIVSKNTGILCVVQKLFSLKTKGKHFYLELCKQYYC